MGGTRTAALLNSKFPCFLEIFAGAHYALLELLVMSAISVLSAHFLMELELSMLICMTAVVVPCAPLCGTRTRRMFLIA